MLFKKIKESFFKKVSSHSSPLDYFELARSWAGDFYVNLIGSRNRWRAICLYITLPMSCLLLISISFLIPLQHLQPILIHHYQDGYVQVEPLKSSYIPRNKLEIESDLVRYVMNRESYHEFAYKEQFSLVNLLSDNAVARDYMAAQSMSNKNSPINSLGNNGYRTVQVVSVVFLDKAELNDPKKKMTPHRNLAQVDFTVTEHNKFNEQGHKTSWIALLSWEYRGMPNDPEQIWKNWNGFTITAYDVQRRYTEESDAQ